MKRFGNRRFVGSALALLAVWAALWTAAPRAFAESQTVSILLIGEDRAAEESLSKDAQWGRADAMVVAVMDLTDGAIRLLSIDREYPVELEGHGRSKLNLACYFGGPRLVMEKVNELFQLDLTLYASVTKKEMEDLAGLVGKIDVYIGEEDLYIDKSFKKPGVYALSKRQVVKYMGARAQDDDAHRNQRQRAVLTAVFQKLLAMKPSKALALLPKALKIMDTNLDAASAMQMALAVLAHGFCEPVQMRTPEASVSTVVNSTRVTAVEDMDAEIRRVRSFLYGPQD
ncbi:MAG TPA: LCP family protein [Clostridia bacterium]|nr:LCP family protein [Clostridia bacterium]